MFANEEIFQVMRGLRQVTKGDGSADKGFSLNKLKTPPLRHNLKLVYFRSIVLFEEIKILKVNLP